MRRWIPYDDWCSRQDSNLYLMVSEAISSTMIGILEHTCHKGYHIVVDFLTWLPYDAWRMV